MPSKYYEAVSKIEIDEKKKEEIIKKLKENNATSKRGTVMFKVRKTLTTIAAIAGIVVCGGVAYAGISGRLNLFNNRIDTEYENKNETKDRSFSDLMNLLYIKDKAKNQDDNILYNYVYDYNDNYSGFEGKDIKAISVIDKEISLVNKDGVNTEKEVKGIDEEVVSVKIGKGEGEIRGIAFLTRNGNVYYLDTDSIIDNKYEAKKIPNLSQVLKIDEVFIAADEETEGEKNLVAVTYDGSYVSIGQ